MVETAVLLIAHGSRHAPANEDLIRLAERLHEKDVAKIVVPCFLELAEPDIAQGGAECVRRGANRVLMVPYFLSGGVHMQRDLKAAQEELAARFTETSFQLGTPLGPDHLLDELVEKRIGELRGVSDGGSM